MDLWRLLPNLYILERSFGGLKEGSGNSTQICSLPLPLYEGRKFSSPLFSFHVCFMLKLPCCCLNVCMFVGMLGRFENYVILDVFLSCLCLQFLRFFLYGCFGITHPWRGHK